ncbi:uncharacterized protein LOC144641549 isoform X1 [Oculina patagonica]
MTSLLIHGLIICIARAGSKHCSRMADNLATMRKLAIAHIIIGLLLIPSGVADRFVGIMWTGDSYVGIWIGAWMCATGTIGIVASRREITSSRKVLTGVFLCLCIESALLGLGLIVTYGFFIRFLWDVATHIPVQIAIASILLTLGISVVVIGIWSAVCCCRTCCTVNPSELEQPFVNPADEPESTSSGDVMTQGSGGVPVVYPVQVSDRTNATQVQGGLLPVILVPTVKAVMDRPHLGGAPMTVPLQVGGGEAVVQDSTSGAQQEGPQKIQQQPSGTQTAVAIQADAGVVAVQASTSRSQVCQPQMITVPTCEVEGGQPQIV